MAGRREHCCDRSALPDAEISVIIDVTYGEDYVLGLKIQKGLESGALQDVIFGKNERGNQFFHEVVDWYLAEDPSKPMPVL